MEAMDTEENLVGGNPRLDWKHMLSAFSILQPFDLVNPPQVCYIRASRRTSSVAYPWSTLASHTNFLGTKELGVDLNRNETFDPHYCGAARACATTSLSKIANKMA